MKRFVVMLAGLGLVGAFPGIAAAAHCLATSSAPSHLPSGECGQFIHVTNQPAVVTVKQEATCRASDGEYDSDSATNSRCRFEVSRGHGVHPVDVQNLVTVGGEFDPANPSVRKPVLVNGPLTNSELRAAGVAVTGPLTDVELRAAGVAVTGPLTDVELRAQDVKVREQGSNSVGTWNEEDSTVLAATHTDMVHGWGIFAFSVGAILVMGVPRWRR